MREIILDIETTGLEHKEGHRVIEIGCIELNNKEVLACDALLKKLKKKLEFKDDTIEGFNVGSNSGKAAGQSINHCHIHLIPRRSGDVDNPQGGVRSVIASKQHYVRKTK